VFHPTVLWYKCDGFVRVVALKVFHGSNLYVFTWYSFEKELKNKLAQKSSGITSEEQVLKKSFKYFDLNGNGTVEPDEFAKAIEKIGIMIPTKQVSNFIDDLFEKFGEW